MGGRSEEIKEQSQQGAQAGRSGHVFSQNGRAGRMGGVERRKARDHAASDWERAPGSCVGISTREVVYFGGRR